MKFFKDDRTDAGYEFAKNRHSELAVFNLVQLELAHVPDGANPFELSAFPFFAACASYAQATDDAAANDFEGGIRIAIWAHSRRIGCTDAEAKAITQEVFATMARISILKARGELITEAFAEEPSEDASEWVSASLQKVEGAVKALALRA